MAHLPNPARNQVWRHSGLLLLFILAAGCSDDAAPVTPPQSPLLALTPTEYNNTICDLFAFPRNGRQWPEPHPVAASIAPATTERAGLFGGAAVEVLPWPWAFPDENGVDDFEGMGDGQLPSAYQVEELQKAANHFAGYSLVSPIFFTCESWDALPEADALACGWSSILRFAQRAWRRPMTEFEIDRLETFWTTSQNDASLEQAIALTVSAVLQSPAFLYKIEQGDLSQDGAAIALSDWEMASRLSYFLWDSMPDAELFGAANVGALSTVDGIASQTIRMLEDPKARAAVISFHHQLLGTDEVRRVAPARRAHAELFDLSPTLSFDQDCDPEWPGILGPIRASLEAETNLFVERTLFDGAGSLTALLTDNHGYMSDATAVIYGDDITEMNGPEVNYIYEMVQLSQGTANTLSLYPVEFPATERAGLLTLPSVLAVGAYAVHPAPILRGKRLLERLACQHLGTPPPGAEALVPPDTDEAEGTNRARTEAATSPQTCAVCHSQLNPPGFAFEHYDALGRYREEDNGEAVDASGSFILESGETFSFSDGVELAYQMAGSPQVQDCYVSRWASYAVGYQLEDGQATLTSLQDDFRESDNVLDLLVAITTSDLFRYLSTEGGAL